jgi:hypothetical protein
MTSSIRRSNGHGVKVPPKTPKKKSTGKEPLPNYGGANVSANRGSGGTTGPNISANRGGGSGPTPPPNYNNDVFQPPVGGGRNIGGGGNGNPPVSGGRG